MPGFKKFTNEVRTRDRLHTFRILYRCTASAYPASGHDVHRTDLDWNLAMAQPSTVTATGFGMCNVPADGRATQKQPDRPRLERWPV